MAQTKPRQPLPPRPAPTPSRRRPARSRKRKANGVGRFLGIGYLVVLAGLALYGGYVFRSSSALRKYLPVIFGAGLHPKTPADVFPGRSAINLLVIGRDYDYTDKDQIIKSRARSDVLMVAHLDFPHKTVSLLSVPRDTRARIPGHGITKINAAHQFGGPALTAQTVQDNFGIPSDKFVALDFDGFEKAIDEISGVDLVVDKKMDYDDNWGHLHIHLRPGLQHLNGQQAMGFVRFRHSDSDLIRVQRQQTLIAALKAKLHQPQMLARLPQILDTLDSHVDSDLTTEQKVVLAQFIHDTPREQIQMSTLPSHPVGNSVATDWPQATPMIQKIFGVSPDQAVAAQTETGRKHRRHHRRLERMADLP